jgi:hypothetical protein
MFILEDPYVSRRLALAAAGSGAPVLDTAAARRALGRRFGLLADEEFVRRYLEAERPRLYANSENAIGWIVEHLPGTPLASGIDLLKDKVRFRDLIADLYPDYRYAGVTLDELEGFDPASMRAPFVVKPAVGFFSMGVHVVDSVDAWPDVLAALHREVSEFASLYPDKVIGFDRFIVEEVIEGEEFAVDAYFDSDGSPVVLNVLGHLFASAADVSDRVYITSAELIERWVQPFATFLAEVGRRAGLRDFPVHAELRVDSNGRVAPIEINPMRFAGWCVTDIAFHAYGIDPYECFMEELVPDWARALERHRGSTFGVVVADIPASVDREAIESVDYEALEARFSRPVEVRRTDFRRYPVLGFVFAAVPSHDLGELRAMLGADLTAFVRMADSA